MRGWQRGNLFYLFSFLELIGEFLISFELNDSKIHPPKNVLWDGGGMYPKFVGMSSSVSVNFF